MKLKQSVNLLLIALFVWAFQSNTIHHQHHEIEEMSECSVCHLSEQLYLHHNNSSTIIVNEHVAVQSTKRVEKIVFKTGFDYNDVSAPAEVLHVAEQHFLLSFPPLGFNATAPPILI